MNSWQTDKEKSGNRNAGCGETRGVSVWERVRWKNKDREKEEESFLHMLFSCVNGRKAGLGSRVASEKGSYLWETGSPDTSYTHVNIIIITEHSKMENGSNLRGLERSACVFVRKRKYVCENMYT